MTQPSETTDYNKHTDEELRQGIIKAEENLRRIDKEGSQEQIQAARDQHDAMLDELESRQTSS